MPSKSAKQHKLMQVVAHNKEIADKRGISQEVAREFLEEDARLGLYQSEKPTKKK